MKAFVCVENRFLGLIGFTLFSLTSYAATPPDHLVLMVFDQMRPDYIDRFNLTQFKRLRAMSQNYTQAYVGYVGSETSVSHIVIPTGLSTRHLPWQDDVFLDKQSLLGEREHFYTTGDLTQEQLTQLIGTLPKEQLLPYRIKQKLKGRVFAVGEKNYATFMLGTPEADSVISVKKSDGKCIPEGKNVPTYISQNDRFTLDCSRKYGTESTFYPLDGSKFVPGLDPAHQGGDVWVGDVTAEIMKNEPWSAIFLTFGGIDKVGHMLGELEGKRPKLTENVQTPFDLKATLKTADQQLGRILDELDQQKLLNRTLIVVTSDHGGQVNSRFLGRTKNEKWASTEGASSKNDKSWISHFAQDPNVRHTFQDTAIRVWLKKLSESYVKSAVKKMSEVPGVVEIYQLKESSGHWCYEPKFSRLEQEKPEFVRWAKLHNLELLNAMAAENSPDLVGLLDDETGFDLVGNHGGAQEKVQRVPLMEWIPGLAPHTLEKPIRLFEISHQVDEIMQLKPAPNLPEYR